METVKSEALRVDVGPSRYLIAQDGSARLLSWRIELADSSWRDVTSDVANSSHRFNVRALPVVGLGESDESDVEFVHYHDSDNCVTFGPKNPELSSSYIPRISYNLSDLSIRLSVSLDNVCAFPLYWCPVASFSVHLPWHAAMPIDQYSLRSRAKKKFILNGDFSVMESSKCPNSFQINLPENGNILAVSGMQDSKVSLATQNEEETLSVIFCGKYPNAYCCLRETAVRSCTELLCMPDLPTTEESSQDWLRHRRVQPGHSDTFTVELSIC
jgi:hypothetical protein